MAMEFGRKRQGCLWGIVLAGGEGERLRGFVKDFLGTDAPKQFCNFTGQRTMLEETLLRAGTHIPADRLVVVGATHHRRHLFAALEGARPGMVLLQPSGRDTGPGILLPLVHVLHQDPRATVAVLPSDHFVNPGRRLMSVVERVAEYLSATGSEDIVLLGVRATEPEPDYGWLEPGRSAGQAGSVAVHRVSHFIEKPTVKQAARLMANGWLWNTMVMVVQAQALWKIVRQVTPDLAAYFSMIRRSIDTFWEPQVLTEVYRMVPSVNFSHAILSHCSERLLVARVENVSWSDCGRGERILASLAHMDILRSPGSSAVSSSIPRAG